METGLEYRLWLALMKFTVLNYGTIESTNNEAIDQARLGADEGLCIVARQQTNGRGRHGRVWMSPEDSGVYMSVVLRPKLDIQYIPLITLAAGIAVYEMLAGLHIKADIKWVNDVLVDGKKISGILGETTDTNRGLAVILGIGINVTNSSFPPVIEQKATSIIAHTDSQLTPSDLIEPLTRQLDHFYTALLSQNGVQTILSEWAKRSTYFRGKHVKVILEGGIIRGTTDGLEPSGALRIITDDGETRIVQAGQLELLRVAEDNPN
jgi:BirA family biotin operon repressor/biotin-[acetyl-CoA-carboxylase] ligase